MSTPLCAAVVVGLLTAVCAAQAATAVNSPTARHVMPMSSAERANLRLTLDWWREVIEAGHLELAPKYQAESYIQHNPNISTGRAGFLAALAKDNSPINPIPAGLKNPPPLAAARGDYVWIMFEKRHASSAAGPAFYQNRFELLRLQGGQVQEHWDADAKRPGSGVVRPGVSPKPPLRFNTGKLTKSELAAREIAVRVASDVYLRGATELAPELIAPDYIEHDPNLQHAGSVTERVAAFVAPQLLLSYEPTIVLVNGEHVLMMWTLFAPDPDNTKQAYRWNYFQLVRVRGGKVVEHWDQDAYKAEGGPANP
ncbi:MAG TPA: nuclear transport factor 2 family protein [Steroidobacteraceae bacterium]